MHSRGPQLLTGYWKKDEATRAAWVTLDGPGGGRVGDVYVCRAVAQREARQRGLPLEQELLRLVIHGTLHVLGHDHPNDARRTRSAMWRKQERYLACLG